MLELVGNASPLLSSSLILGQCWAPAWAAWPPTMSPLITGTGGLQCSAQIWADPTLRPSRRSCGVGGLDLPPEPTGSLRARAILIREALARALIVLALTLCPVYHWTSQWRAPSLGEGMGEAERGTGGGGVGAFIELQLKGLFQRGSVDQRKECLCCVWVMGWARGKNGQPVERAVCLSGLAWAPQTDHWSQRLSEQERRRRQGRAHDLRSPVNSE